jgi:hypothetical protein
MARISARLPTVQPGAGSSRTRRNDKRAAKSIAVCARPPDYKSVCTQARAKPLAERLQH